MILKVGILALCILSSKITDNNWVMPAKYKSVLIVSRFWVLGWVIVIGFLKYIFIGIKLIRTKLWCY